MMSSCTGSTVGRKSLDNLHALGAARATKLSSDLRRLNIERNLEMIVMRENLTERVNELPDTYLDELAEFIEYLFWKYESTKTVTELLPIEDDPIVGLFSGESDLAEKSEEILKQEITNYSGWTWKRSQE